MTDSEILVSESFVSFFPVSDLSFCAELDESAEFLSSELFFSIISEGCFWRTKITTAVNKTIIMKTVPTARTALESNLNFSCPFSTVFIFWVSVISAGWDVTDCVSG